MNYVSSPNWSTTAGDQVAVRLKNRTQLMCSMYLCYLNLLEQIQDMNTTACF